MKFRTTCYLLKDNMDMFRTNSPEGGTFSFVWRKKAFSKSPNPVQNYSEDKSFFTSSLPTPTLEFSLRSSKFSNSLERPNEIVDEDSCDLSPPHSNQRPRSASLHASLVPTAGQLQVQGKRKSLRTLTRSRPSSARFGRRGSDSLSLEQEATTGIYKVDNAFAKIRSQLAQLSEEDTILQERLDRLTTEINYMQRCVGGLQYSHYVVPSSPEGPAPRSPVSQPPSPSPPPPPRTTSPNIPLVKVSSTQSDILAIAEETWEEEREFENEGYLQNLHEKKSKYHSSTGHGQQQASQNIPEIRKKESLGSCGSLADSEGSLSPGRQTCCIVVVDHDKCLLSPRPLNFSYEASSPRTLKFNYGAGTSQKYNYEDDVFFT